MAAGLAARGRPGAGRGGPRLRLAAAAAVPGRGELALRPDAAAPEPAGWPGRSPGRPAAGSARGQRGVGAPGRGGRPDGDGRRGAGARQRCVERGGRAGSGAAPGAADWPTRRSWSCSATRVLIRRRQLADAARRLRRRPADAGRSDRHPAAVARGPRASWPARAAGVPQSLAPRPRRAGRPARLAVVVRQPRPAEHAGRPRPAARGRRASAGGGRRVARRWSSSGPSGPGCWSAGWRRCARPADEQRRRGPGRAPLAAGPATGAAGRGGAGGSPSCGRRIRQHAWYGDRNGRGRRAVHARRAPGRARGRRRPGRVRRHRGRVVALLVTDETATVHALGGRRAARLDPGRVAPRPRHGRRPTCPTRLRRRRCAARWRRDWPGSPTCWWLPCGARSATAGWCSRRRASSPESRGRCSPGSSGRPVTVTRVGHLVAGQAGPRRCGWTPPASSRARGSPAPRRRSRAAAGGWPRSRGAARATRRRPRRSPTSPRGSTCSTCAGARPALGGEPAVLRPRARRRSVVRLRHRPAARRCRTWCCCRRARSAASSVR